jgi:hypothetical protein
MEANIVSMIVLLFYGMVNDQVLAQASSQEGSRQGSTILALRDRTILGKELELQSILLDFITFPKFSPRRQSKYSKPQLNVGTILTGSLSNRPIDESSSSPLDQHDFELALRCVLKMYIARFREVCVTASGTISERITAPSNASATGKHVIAHHPSPEIDHRSLPSSPSASRPPAGTSATSPSSRQLVIGRRWTDSEGKRGDTQSLLLGAGRVSSSTSPTASEMESPVLKLAIAQRRGSAI